MQTYTILICDDDSTVRDSLADYCAHEGFAAVCASTAEDALEIIRHRSIDLVVLDIMLPGQSGLEACQEIRKLCDVPILMLSAKGTTFDRITGLETGADDYVPKPFSPREVMIRIRRVLERRDAVVKPRTLSLAELTVFPESNQVTVNGQTISLTAKETQVLAFLIGNAGKITTREQILNAVWGYEYFGDTRVVDTLVKRIRKKIIQEDVHFALSSAYGMGYKIEEIK
ncbi:MAG: response regulator transcription factor [Eubacteriales bacterium]|nr:response regulator transcription factor [Eubacteriales bacterium]